MKERKNYSSQFEANNLLDLLIKYWKPLAIVVLVAVVVSAIVSLMIQEKYRSTVILYPTSSASVSKSLLSNTSTENDLLAFGEEEEVEQMIQVLKSSDIRDRIIEKFSLKKHYQIDTNARYPITNLHRKYDKNININRTEYQSVEIEVLDRSPDTAALIANTISTQLDSVMNQMKQERASKALKLVEKEYLNQKEKLQSMQNKLNDLHNHGVFEFASQTEVYNDQYAKSLADGNYKGAKLIKEQLDTLAKYGAAYTDIMSALEFEQKKLTEIESKYKEAKIDAEQDLPYKYVVNKAVKAEKKSYPVRWLIVILSTVSAFLLAVIVLIIFENVKKK
ncbi:MAG: Wzz/FepE/Etk N-terminal domain-containing protein [Candidatus Delongbacteria bacterium]|nr:Wzz/FepE/Etk N-terminal domain-containing protein [Candidatus Delongbacteria bacterium]